MTDSPAGTNRIRPRKTVFLRMLEAEDKKSALLQSLRGMDVTVGRTRFHVDPDEFSCVPGSPFAYWVGPELRKLFEKLPLFDNGSRTAKRGPSTCDDGRYLRTWWEVPAARTHNNGVWHNYAKGGIHSPFYADIYLVVDWETRRSTFLGFFGRPGREIEKPESVDYFFRAGLTWPRRTKSSLSMRALPSGCIFADKGPSAFAIDDDPTALLSTLAISSSRVFHALVEFQLAAADAKPGGAAHSFEVGIIQRTPVPVLAPTDRDVLAALAHRAWSLKRTLDTRTETSHAFTLPALLQPGWQVRVTAAEKELAAIQADIDQRCFDLYGIDSADRVSIVEGFEADNKADPETPAEDEEAEDEDGGEDVTNEDAATLAAELLSWSVGVVFGRFDVRLATGARPIPPEPGPFDPLPACSPGMLTGDDGLPLPEPPPGYPIAFPGDGVLVDDPGHPRDLTTATRAVFQTVFGPDADARWQEAAALLDPKGRDLRAWLAKSFFGFHLKRYSKSRRRAPILWQFGTPSASWSAWVYAHRATGDTLFGVLNDLLAPRLADQERRLAVLVQEAGPHPTASQRREIATVEALVEELRTLRDEVARVAPLWKPDLDDGVLLTLAPLWRLVPHRAWQRELKTAWDALVEGQYDWAHLAMHLWPERVVPKCAADRSLAIAHGLEAEFWSEGADGRWSAQPANPERVEALVRERTKPAVKAALESLLEAGGAPGNGKGVRKRRG